MGVQALSIRRHGRHGQRDNESGCQLPASAAMSIQQAGPPAAGAQKSAPCPGARVGIVMLDEGRQIVSLDAAAQQIFGACGRAFAGRPFASLLGAPRRHASGHNGPADHGEAHASAPGHADRCMGQRADGSVFSIELDIVDIEPPGGHVPRARFAAFVRDLSTPSAPQLELRKLELQLHTLIELSPIAIWITEHEHVAFANRAAARLMGVESGGALVGQSVASFLSVNDQAEFRRQLANALSHEGKLGSLQAQLIRHPQSETREVEIALAALPDHGRTTVQMVVSDVTQRNGELRAIERSRRLSRRLSANIVEAREEERRRIARELHDELGQRLSALKMDLEDCAGAGTLKAQGERVPGLLAQLDSIMGSVRRIATDLRPAMLDDLGLSAAVESLAHDFAQRVGVAVQLQLDPVEPPIDDKVSTALYRMVQESLTNVAHHASATEVQISLHRDGDELVLSVRDNGVGLPSTLLPQRDCQFGLLGMQERADALGGRLELDSPADGGVCVRVHLPAEPRSATGKRNHRP
jgi:two-component system sensor histidine kinase UhpB